MKLGFDAKRLFYNNTGLGNYSRTLVFNLMEFYNQAQYYLYTPLGKSSTISSKFFDRKNCKIVRNQNSVGSYWRTFGIRKNVKNDDLDIYHGLSNELPYGLNNINVKKVVTIHDLIYHKRPTDFSIIDRNIFSLKTKHACTIANKIVAISKSTKNDIIEILGVSPSKIEVVYQSCAPQFYTIQTPTELAVRRKNLNLPSEYLLFVGSVEPRKNFSIILEAYQELSDSYQIPIVVVGRGQAYLNKMKALATSFGLEGKVIWLTDINKNDDLQAIYQLATLFIYPSHYEGFGLPVVESLLSGTPVITSNNSSLTEAGGPSSYYVDSHDKAQMATAITMILSSDSYRNEMSIKGMEYAKFMFSSKKSSKDMMSLYKELT